MIITIEKWEMDPEKIEIHFPFINCAEGTTILKEGIMQQFEFLSAFQLT